MKPSVLITGACGGMGKATADALASFQALNNLPMTGNLDKVTWKHLALHFPLAANRQNRSEPETRSKMLPIY